MAGTGSRAAYILRACPWKMSPSGGLVWTPTRPPPRRPASCPSGLVDTWLISDGGPCPLAGHLLWSGGWDTLPLGGGIGPGWREGIWERIGRILFFGVIFPGSVRCWVLAAGLLGQSRVI